MRSRYSKVLPPRIAFAECIMPECGAMYPARNGRFLCWRHTLLIRAQVSLVADSEEKTPIGVAPARP